MLLIHCPYCDVDRPEIEFKYAGEGHLTRPPDPAAANDEAWGAFLYLRANVKGLHAERWRHTSGCGRYFNCLRDTVSDKFSATYKAGQARPNAG